MLCEEMKINGELRKNYWRIRIDEIWGFGQNPDGSTVPSIPLYGATDLGSMSVSDKMCLLSVAMEGAMNC